MESSIMSSIETFTTFLGWSAVINIGILLAFLSLMSIISKDGLLVGLSVNIFGNTKEDTLATTFQIYQQYRLLVVVFNIVPYISLKIMY